MYKLSFLLLLVAGAAHAETKSAVAFGTPTVKGKLDASVVVTTVKKAETRILACYQRALQDPAIKDGSATLAFTIQLDGSLANVAIQSTGLTPAVESCLAAVLAKLTFGKQADGAIDVTYPVSFTSTTTIGSAAGWGVGSDGAHQPVMTPSLRIGEPKVKGDLDKAIVRRYIRRQVQKLMYCYEKELLAKPKLAGTVTAKFTISAEGTVAIASASGMDTTVGECVTRVIEMTQFPKPKSGEVTVTYPFVYQVPRPIPRPKR